MDRWIDIEDLQNGYQYSRDARLRENEIRREQREFEALCKRLYERQWYHSKAEQEPEYLEKRAKKARSWRERNPEKYRAQRERESAARRAKLEQRKRTIQCLWCSGEVRTTLSYQRFCSEHCCDKFHNRRLAQRRNTGQRRMNLRTEILALLGQTPWLNRAQLAELLEHEPSAVSHVLSKMLAAGAIQHCGRRMNRRYAAINK